MGKNNIHTITIIIFLLSLSQALSLTFITNPSIDNATKSDQDVNCQWESSADTIQTNVTWYNNSIPLINTNNTISPATLSKTYTKRGETWMCEVILFNGTNILSKNATVTIKNADPTNLRLYNLSNNFLFSNETNLYEDTNYSFYLNATEYDNDPLQYTSLNLPNGASLSNGGQFSWMPTYSDVGEKNITFLALDNYIQDIGTDALAFIMNVILVNDAPTFSPSLVNWPATEDSLFEYNIIGADEESNYPLSFNVSCTTLPEIQISTISNTSVRLYFTPDYEDFGNHTVTVNMTDSLNASRIGSFNISISRINQVPAFTYIENKSGVQGESYFFTIKANDTDTNDTLNFGITPLNCSISGIWNLTTLNNSATNATGLINITNLTNNHIICRNVNITVTDSKTTASYLKTLNLTNTNDPPIIHNNSFYAGNSIHNMNINNLSGAVLIGFSYRINFSDPDTNTYEGEVLRITSLNQTGPNLFQINNQTGEIVFTPNETDVGQHLYLLNLSDDQGIYTQAVINITIINNTIPQIDPPIPNITIFEKEIWTYDVNATDYDGNTNITYFDNTSLFDINQSTGLISFTPIQEDLGNHSITVYATDNFGTTSESTFKLEILNKNDAPIIEQIIFPTIVANHTMDYTFSADDEDLLLQNSTENLTFQIIWKNSTTNLTNLFNITKINQTEANIIFRPNESMIGNYTIQIIAIDQGGLNDTQELNFTIYNISYPPRIVNMTPYGPPQGVSTNLTGWINVSDYEYTYVEIIENTAITFNHTTTNPEPDENMSYYWYKDGILLGSGYHLSYDFNYDSEGTTNITLVVMDSKYGTDSLTWRMNITNLNREVQFISNPDGLTINCTAIESDNYLKNALDGVFYDPDDDLNSNGAIDGAEINRLNFSYEYYSGSTSIMDIAFSDMDVTFTPRGVGEVRYNFTASDGYSNATTSAIIFNVSYSSGCSPPQPVPQPQNKNPKPVYYQIEVDKIVNREILFPKPITMFENNTGIIPVVIKNIGNTTLYGIELSATTQNKEVKMTFNQKNIEYLLPMEEKTVELKVESYRTQGTYEIEISSKTTDPQFTDQAVILVNSVQKEDDDTAGLAVTKTKIAFAQDLLSSNPKCLELNEMLLEIEDDVNNNRNEVASEKIENLIKTCRYLIESKEPQLEKPNLIYINLEKFKNNKKLLITVITLLSIGLIGTLYSIYYTNKE